MAATLSTTVTRIEFDNPYLLGSGPPGTNAKVIAKSFDLGWGGVVGKTISLDATKVVNTAPRYGKLKDWAKKRRIQSRLKTLLTTLSTLRKARAEK